MVLQRIHTQIHSLYRHWRRIHTQIITSIDTGGESTCKSVTVDTWGESMYKLVTTQTYLGILEGTPENMECGLME